MPGMSAPPRRAGRVLALLLASSAVFLLSCASGPDATFTSVHAGERHTCAIDDRGQAWCWGANRFGQLGDGTNLERDRPVHVAGEHVFVSLDLGSTHTCGIDATGAVWCWGGNFVGKLGNGTAESSSVPTQVVGLPGPASAVNATSDRSCAIVEESLWCWGDNTQNVMGIDRSRALLRPAQVLPAGVRAHALGPGKGCIATDQVLCVGIDVDGGQPVDGFAGVAIDGIPADTAIVELAGAQFIYCGRADTGRVFCWGSLSWFIDDSGDVQENVWFKAAEIPGTTATRLAAMDATVCVLENEQVVCRGRLPGEGWVLSGGTGTPEVNVGSLGGPWVIPFPGGRVIDVSGGSAHICAVVEDGEIWCSGSNSNGQLGNAGGEYSLEPVRVAA